MSNALATLAQNTAVIANGLELGCQIIDEIAGGEDVGNNFNGKPVDRLTLQSWLADEINASCKPLLGG